MLEPKMLVIHRYSYTNFIRFPKLLSIFHRFCTQLHSDIIHRCVHLRKSTFIYASQVLKTNCIHFKCQYVYFTKRKVKTTGINISDFYSVRGNIQHSKTDIKCVHIQFPSQLIHFVCRFHYLTAYSTVICEMKHKCICSICVYVYVCAIWKKYFDLIILLFTTISSSCE